MRDSAAKVLEASYDVVGRYSQDEINGFSEELLERLLDLAQLQDGQQILDAMAGDGNLTRRLLSYCDRKAIAPGKVTLLEFSRVQCEFARAELAGQSVRVIRGDAPRMVDLDSGEELPAESFDRVLIKSALHELPLAEQHQLFAAVMRALKPGGLFINLGFVFDDATEQREFREVARTKDSLAGLTAAAQRRHFVTRDELHPALAQCGFVDVNVAETFQYRIRSDVVARHYFRKPGLEHADAEFQVSQARSLTMRRKGRIRFDGERTEMILPGEITVARKPAPLDSTRRTFAEYPYDFVRKIGCHAELLDRVTAWIPSGSDVLDLGCGPGLLAERLIGRGRSYRGIDLSPEFVSVCRDRYGGEIALSFEVGDANEVDLGSGHDVVTLLNVLYIEGVKPVQVLQAALDSLRPGGRLIVSGPNAPDSWQRVESKIREQLDRDGHLPQGEDLFRAVCRANDRLVTARGSYWSAEGMVALLEELGAQAIRGVDTGIYYGCGYLVIATK